MIDRVFAFPDSNVFLHYKPLSQIDWCGLLDAQAVTLVVCRPVIKELDQKKSDSRLAERARRSIKEIQEHESASKPLRAGVHLELYHEQVRRDDFPEGLNPDSQDDCIIYLVKKYESKYPDRTVCLLSEDYGMMLSCRTSAVAVHKPNEVDRLENPGDEKDKKIKQLQTEVATLKHRLPRLSLKALAPAQDIQSEEPYRILLEDNWVPLVNSVELEKQRTAHPKRSGKQAQASPQDRSPLSGFSAASRIFEHGITDDQWKRYDAEIDSYLAAYEQFVEHRNSWGSNRTRSFEFVFSLQNSGSGPATNIDVVLRFPSRLAYVAAVGTEEARLLLEPSPPKPPERPKPSFLAARDQLGYLGTSSLADFAGLRDLESRSRFDPDDPNVEVHLRPGEGHIIHAKLVRLKHSQGVVLGPFVGVFANWEAVYPFEVDYTISANELPDQPSGRIGVQIRK